MVKKLFMFSATVPILLGISIYWANIFGLLDESSLIEGAFEDIDIYKIEYGVKVVNAQTYLGAIYGLGYLTARDRLWQLQFLRLLSQGRLCEVNQILLFTNALQFAGMETLEVDKIMRMWGITWTAKETLNILEPDDKEMYN